jgi:hypothetical protein
MRILIAIFVGVAIGYAAFSPDMASMRQEWLAKMHEMVASK